MFSVCCFYLTLKKVDNDANESYREQTNLKEAPNDVIGTF